MSKNSKRKRKKKKRRKSMPDDKFKNIDLDKIFCINAKKYGVEKLLLKAMGKVESNLNPKAFRHEPAFWTRYLADNPDWKDRDPQEVSSSYGIMQLMYTTAHMLGFRGTGEELYDPVINIMLGAKLLRKQLDKIRKDRLKLPWYTHTQIALARYNGGYIKNPDSNGELRNVKYVNLVKAAYKSLQAAKDKECL